MAGPCRTGSHTKRKPGRQLQAAALLGPPRSPFSCAFSSHIKQCGETHRLAVMVASPVQNSTWWNLRMGKRSERGLVRLNDPHPTSFVFTKAFGGAFCTSCCDAVTASSLAMAELKGWFAQARLTDQSPRWYWGQ